MMPGGGMPGGMMPGGFPGGGIMNVGPDKVVKVKVPVVCLEYGKKDPNPRLKYEIRPIESFTQQPSVVELCKMVGRGEVSQNTAEAVAWHLSSGVTFKELAGKNRTESLDGLVEKFFSKNELNAAGMWVKEAAKRAEAAAQRASAPANSLGR